MVECIAPVGSGDKIVATGAGKRKVDLTMDEIYFLEENVRADMIGNKITVDERKEIFI